mgnify:FL=1
MLILTAVGGFFLVLYKWGVFGLAVECYGFFELFGDLAPQVSAYVLIPSL